MFYIESKGKGTKAQQISSKKLSGAATLQTTAQITDAKIFLEGQGFQEGPIVQGALVVNVKKEELDKKLSALQLTCQFGVNLHRVFLQIVFSIRSVTPDMCRRNVCVGAQLL